MSDVITTARSLAARSPGGRLPCPVCTSTLDVGNLETHLAKQHASISLPAEIKGGDGRILITASILSALLAIVTLALVAADIAKPGTAPLIVCALVLFGTMGLTLAGLIHVLPAKLVVGPSTLTLVHSLGLGRRTAKLPCPVEIGTRMEHRDGVPGGGLDSGYGAHYDAKAGTYLRIAGPAPITVGCKSSAGTSAHWTGWTRGKNRRTFDILVDRKGLVALEYALAARGVLTLTPPSTGATGSKAAAAARG